VGAEGWREGFIEPVDHLLLFGGCPRRSIYKGRHCGRLLSADRQAVY
jgi:hypothetical protein